MRGLLAAAVWACAAGQVAGCAANEPEFIDGLVVDVETGQGIVGADVARKDVETLHHVVVRTDEAGRFSIAGPRERTILQVTAGGYCEVDRATSGSWERIGLSRVEVTQVGIGVRIGDGLVVTEVQPDGPAVRAGILVGDRLIAVDGRRLRPGVDEGAARKLIRAGPRGSNVSIDLVRDDVARHFALERYEYRTPCVPIPARESSGRAGATQ